ncbi:hypothetical protein [Allomuricauda sp. F6463D]|uniref:hypothetical protein n=1 Tax=Allomuricauda sp. F6463D TaxID=2926409 RepID=UPI001FF56E42|nr:hypothetical protein [Muricauda sp. F6463D]MCK0161547.1 hypothetical protein [Muricauda sp. F6463D]
MKIIKISSLVLAILLAILCIAALLMGGFMPLFAIAFGIIAVFYVLIYIALNKLSKRKNRMLLYIIYLLFLTPIVWTIIDMEGLFEFLLQGVKMDMK